MNATTAIRTATIAATAAAVCLPVMLSMTGQTGAASHSAADDRGVTVVQTLADENDGWPWD